jgi:hypothetical protein
MDSNLLNSDNWTYCHYASQNQKAIISIGASPEMLAEEFEYYVTILDQEEKTVFQTSFTDLTTAITYANRRFNKIWKFVDARFANKKEGSCSTCVAH